MKMLNKKVISCLLVFVMVLTIVPMAVFTTNAAEITEKASNLCQNGHNYSRKVNSVAHRGYSWGAPENTLPAYTMAKEKGFYYAECDVTYTSDGVPVLMHLEDISHTSNGTGLVTRLTYEQLLKYDYGSWKGAEFKGTKIPTFEEFIAHCAKLDIHPYIELKDHGNHTSESIKELVDIVKEYGMLRQCTWISFVHDYAYYITAYDPYARIGLLWPNDVNSQLINKAISVKTSTNEIFLDVQYTSLTEEGVERAKNNGFPLEVYTIDDEETILNMPEYISGVTSDLIVAQNVLNKPQGVVTAPTCTERGYTTYTCVDCGYSYEGDYVDALGHDYDENGDCWRCTIANGPLSYYVMPSADGGNDSNHGRTVGSPLATINKAVKLAIEAGAKKGDTVTVYLNGNVKFGAGVSSIDSHDFTLVIASKGEAATVSTTNNFVLGGPTVFENVVINAGDSWKYFGFGGNSVTFDGSFTSEWVDVHLGNGSNILNITEEVNTNINGFIRKLGLGNTWNTVTYYEDCNINFNGTDGDPNSIGYLLCLGAIQYGETVFNKALNITTERVEPFQFTNGSSLYLGSNGYFNFINNNTATTIERSSMGLSSSVLSKTWVLNNKSTEATVTPTKVKGEFAVEKGYIAKAKNSSGTAIKSNGGILKLSAGQYEITVEPCTNHVYDNDTDANCNNCGAVRSLGIDVINGCDIIPALASGTVNGTVGTTTLENCVGTHATRLYTLGIYKVADIEKITVGENSRIYVQFFDAKGDYIGGSNWQGTGTYNMMNLSSADKATYFKVTLSGTKGGYDASTPSADSLKFTVPHTYDNSCDAECNKCGEGHKPSDHDYDNACDTGCNICGTTRKVADHTYKKVKITDATTSKNGKRYYECEYCGKEKTSTIYKVAKVYLSTAAYAYNGKAKKPSVKVYDSKGNKLTEGEDYTCKRTTKSSTKVGKYKVTVTFKGDYTGTKNLYYTIGPKNTSSVKATLYGYDDVKVTWKKVSGASGYKVYYKKSSSDTWSSKTTTSTSTKLSNLSDGVKYEIKVVAYKTISGVKCYNSGKETSIYTLKKITGVKVAKSSGKVKVSWKNISGESGYQISKTTSKSKTDVVSTYKTTSGKSKSISATKGKTYYYKVRAYKTVDGKKIYGPWSDPIKYVKK